jgi:hypothetical protein
MTTSVLVGVISVVHNGTTQKLLVTGSDEETRQLSVWHDPRAPAAQAGDILLLEEGDVPDAPLYISRNFTHELRFSRLLQDLESTRQANDLPVTQLSASPISARTPM